MPVVTAYLLGAAALPVPNVALAILVPPGSAPQAVRVRRPGLVYPWLRHRPRAARPAMTLHVSLHLDSINAATRHRLTTFVIRLPRAAVWEDFLTHRMLSRNASSSRAIPVVTMVERSTWEPETFGRNTKGMVAAGRLDSVADRMAHTIWRRARRYAAARALQLANLGVAKEDANLLMRPFEWMDVIMSATHWDNFFRLRTAPDAKPSVRKIAQIMYEQYNDLACEAVVKEPGEWHLPFIREEEYGTQFTEEGLTFASPLHLARASAARCARISYAKHDGTSTTAQADADWCSKMLVGPEHWSPLECPAQALSLPIRMGNYTGWAQLRKLYPGERQSEL
jgi:hypothetical protein